MKSTRKIKSIFSMGLSLVLLSSNFAYSAPLAWSGVGVAGGVKGTVRAFPPGAATPVGRVLSSGQPLYLGETINTGAEGSLQVMLNDETVFTIGPRSSMVLDEFVYDPQSHAGQVVATVKKGLFRFVTGLIGHKKPSSMKVKFPTAVMGIRGTIVAGEVTETGATTAVLLGPGPATNAPKERVGAFSMENAGVTVDVLKPGYATHVDGPNVAPSVPALLPREQLNGILEGLSHAPTQQSSAAPKPSAPSEQASNQDQKAAPTEQNEQGQQASNSEALPESDQQASAGDAAGQTTADATGDLSGTQDITDLGTDLSNATVVAANDIGNPDLASFIPYYQSSWDDVGSITNGTGYYSGSDVFNLTQCNGGACAGPTGSINMYLDIDFGAKTIGSAASNVTVSASDANLNAAINDTVNLPVQSFAALTGAATISGTSASGATNAHISVLNFGGTAQSAIGIASYSGANGTTGSGAVGAMLTCTSGTCH